MTDSVMTETQYNDLVDQLMFDIEQAVDENGADIDYENSAGVLTLTMEANGSVVIVSRQPAIGQIWVAARSGGFHFLYNGEFWVSTTTGETLQQLLCRTCSEQMGEPVDLDF